MEQEIHDALGEHFLSDGTTFNLFDHIDEAIIQAETREVWVTKQPRVWPSAASVELYDQTQHKIAGKCGRSVFLSWLGFPPGRKISVEGAMKMVIGKLLENQMNEYAKAKMKDRPSIYIANGVRIFVEDILLRFELDTIVLNPLTNQGVIVEQKSFTTKNYQKGKEILKEGRPALDNLIQACLYLMEVKTGARLRDLIISGVKDRKEKDARAAEMLAKGLTPFPHHNRIEVDFDNLEKMDDGPLAIKLAYLDRSDGFRKEMDITIHEDPIDQLTYPVVDGQIWKLFPLEGVYERFRNLQRLFYAARQEAERRLLEQGIEPPLELVQLMHSPEEKAAFSKAEKEYWDLLGQEMRALPPSYWPPAEYEFEYSPEKIEMLWGKGLIAKTRYEGWKRKHKGKERIGDWQCQYCDHMRTCLAVEKPELKHLLDDFAAMEDDAA